MKVLMVGLGGAGQRLLRHLREQLGPAGDFAAYRVRNRPGVIAPDLRSISGADLAAEYGLRLFGTLGEGLDWRPDAVVVANPTNLHASTALAAVKAGAHVLVEKPLSHDRADVEELQDRAARSGKVAMVGYMMRFHPTLNRIEGLLRSNGLGRPLWAQLEAGSYVPDWHPYEDHADLYALHRAAGGGVVLTESHELDLAAWLFGAPAAVAAFGGKKSSLPGDAEDTASILLDCGFPVHVNLCFAQRPARRAIRIALEKGFIEWQGDATLRVHHADRRDWETTSDAGFERDHLFRDQVRHFLACIEGRESPRVDVAAARTSLEMALSALTQIGRSH